MLKALAVCQKKAELCLFRILRGR